MHSRMDEAQRLTHFSCAATKQCTAGGNEPADCDWPTCGCDGYAERVIEALQESGWLSPNEKNEYARKVREQAFREAAAERALED